MLSVRIHALILVALAAMAAPSVAQDAQPITAWRAYGGAGVPAQWVLADGTITHTPGGGDLISVDSFRNFDLSFEWRISPGSNSGVMFRVGEQYGASFQSGPEYQILDNTGHPDGQSPLTSAASAFALYAPSADVTRPAGDWNAARIVVNGAHVEHWLNGQLVVAYDLGSPDWKGRVAASKFADWPAYGTLPEGHIVLQDHGDSVDFRNVTIRRLPN